MMTLDEIKKEITNRLEGYVCKNQEILEDLPKLITSEGVVEHCLSEAIDSIYSGFEFFCESEEESNFNLDAEIEYQVSRLINMYQLEKIDTKEIDSEEDISYYYDIDSEIAYAIDELITRKKSEEEYDEVYDNRYSSSYLYIGYTDGCPDIQVFDERCIPDWFDVVEEIECTDFTYIKNQYKKLFNHIS